MAFGTASSAAILLNGAEVAHSSPEAFNPHSTEGPGLKPGLPMYTRADVAKHNKPDDLWVTFRNGVYDVTEFQSKHPGGNKILLAAGGAVDPFWAFYQQHQHSHVHEILAKYRVGTLDPKDVKAAEEAASAVGDPYAKDPKRAPFIKAHSTKPFNGEPPAAMLVDSFITPAEVLFVRHHLPVPHLDESKHELTLELQMPADPSFHPARPLIDGEDDGSDKPVPAEIPVKTVRSVKLSMADIKSGGDGKWPIVKVVTAITCSGNRRANMARRKEARGLSWDVSAMGNVEFTGVRLRDVLMSELGVSEADVMGPEGGEGTLKHVQFEGCDIDPAAGTKYGASIPADKALSQWGDVILAFEMNGKPIPADHGFPLRAVVPGYTAARQVKWLGKVVVGPNESQSLWQQKDYKLFPPTMDWNNVDFGSMPAMQEMPVQSAICEPMDGGIARVDKMDKKKEAVVKGWAWAGGGRAITRVDVSPDNGKSWVVADITAKPYDPSPSKTRTWGWTLWTAVVPLGEGVKDGDKVTLAVKALDVAGNTQPEDPLTIWNYRGLANNAIHRATVTVKMQ